MKIAFDQASLAREWGVHIYKSPGVIANDLELMDRSMSFDAQPHLVGIANAGIPALLTTVIDPNLIKVIQAPMKAAMAFGERKYGDWITDTMLFPVLEPTGETSSYGDFNNNGSANANLNYPNRQAYTYQTIAQWGEREAERMGLARIDWASQINSSAQLVLNKYQNLTYIYGVQGLQNYGSINDPSLPAPIAVTTTWSAADGPTIYGDVSRLFTQLVLQSGGLVDADSSVTLVLSPGNAMNLNKTNIYNLNVYDLLKKNYSKLKIVTIPEYATAGTGNTELVQLIVDEIDGQKTCTTAFTEKLRSHALVTELSSWKQKKSQGSWGFILFRPFAVAQMYG